MIFHRDENDVLPEKESVEKLLFDIPGFHREVHCATRGGPHTGCFFDAKVIFTNPSNMGVRHVLVRIAGIEAMCGIEHICEIRGWKNPNIVVAGVPNGGIPFAEDVIRFLNRRISGDVEIFFLPVEKMKKNKPGRKFKIGTWNVWKARQFLKKGANKEFVLVVCEDVVTTAGSVKDLFLEIAKRFPPFDFEKMCLAILDRSMKGIKMLDNGASVCSLLHYFVETYSPEACPLCKGNIPLLEI